MFSLSGTKLLKKTALIFSIYHPHYGMLLHRRTTSQGLIRRHSSIPWVESGTVRVKCPTQAYNRMTATRLEPRPLKSTILVITCREPLTLFVHSNLIFFSCCFSGSCPMQTTRKNCCVFPFIYRRRRYTSCTRVKSKRPWCATTSNYDKDKMWGYCPGGAG